MENRNGRKNELNTPKLSMRLDRSSEVKKRPGINRFSKSTARQMVHSIGIKSD